MKFLFKRIGMFKSTQGHSVPVQLVAALAFLLAGTAAVLPSHAAEIEPLNDPSVISSKWRSLWQLDVTRAGRRLVSVGERGAVMLSDDNGISWRQSKVPVSTTLTHVFFINEKTGWIVGHAGVALKTNDGGENWEKTLDGFTAAKIELAAASADSNDSELSQRRISEAKRLVDDGPDKPFLSVRFQDAQRGLVVGAFGLAYETVDGGGTWQSVVGRLDAGQRRHLYSAATSGGQLYLVGEQGIVLQSMDGGASFAVLPFPGKGTLFGLLTVNSTLIAYGLKGAAYRSTDHGKNWVTIGLPQASVTASLRMSNGDLILGNEAGQLFVSKDGGESFRQLKVRNPAPISGLAEAADSVIVQVGVRGVSRVEVVNEESIK